jgi:amidohydrolase
VHGEKLLGRIRAQQESGTRTQFARAGQSTMHVRRRSGSGDSQHEISGTNSALVDCVCAVFRTIFCALLRAHQRNVATRDDALNERRIGAVRRRHLRRIQHTEPAGRARSYVEKVAATPESVYDEIDGMRQLLPLLADGFGDHAVFSIDQIDDFEGVELIDPRAARIALLGESWVQRFSLIHIHICLPPVRGRSYIGAPIYPGYPPMTTLLDRAVALEPELTTLRRDIHRHPELAFEELRTAELAAKSVADLGFSVRTQVARTGVVADLEHGAGPVVALRADMDALPIHEENDVPWRSSVDGVMHACGHDAHVAMLIGAARLIAAARETGDLPAGTIRLLFQPSEERTDRDNKSGARRMIDEGALDGVQAIFGLHIGAHLQSGIAHISSGPIMAGSDVFTAVVVGKGAHAARPQEGTDAIVLASHAIIAAQNAVARRLAPADEGVLTIGMIRGGTAENVIAERVFVRGTLRYYEDHVRGTLHRELRNALAVAEALGGKTRIDVQPGYPPVINDVRVTEIARSAAQGALGDEAVQPFPPDMTAEDFSLYQRLAPGCFIWLGAALPDVRAHHTPRFDVDEKVLPKGAALLAACAIRALEEMR